MDNTLVRARILHIIQHCIYEAYERTIVLLLLLLVGVSILEYG